MTEKDAERLVKADELEELGQWEQAAWWRLWRDPADEEAAADRADLEVYLSAVGHCYCLEIREPAAVPASKRRFHLRPYWSWRGGDGWRYFPLGVGSRCQREPEAPARIRRLIEEAARLAVWRVQ